MGATLELRHKFMYLIIIFTLLFSSVLGGCSSSFHSEEARCIKTVLVSSLSEMPLSSFIHQDSRKIKVAAFKAGCGGTSPDLPGGYDDIGLHITLKIPNARHPKGHITEITVPLFVALLDLQDNVLDRQDEALKLKISDYAFSQAYKITYRPPEGIALTSTYHKILVGFNKGEIKAPPFKRESPSLGKKKAFFKKELPRNKKKQVKQKKFHKHKHVKKGKKIRKGTHKNKKGRAKKGRR